MKTYIVLPFKDRNGKYKKALDEFIDPFIEYINRQLTDYEIIIVEQSGGSLKNTLPKRYESLLTNNVIRQDDEFFNLGRTINIGYDIIRHKIKEDDIFMFHPVDILPIDVDYSIDKTTKFCYKEHSPEGSYYKAIAFKCSDFKKVNGFSNNYWGWGWEDDDMGIRLTKHNIACDIVIDNYRRLSNDGNGKAPLGPDMRAFHDEDHYMPLYYPNQIFINEIKSYGSEISGLNNLSYSWISTEKFRGIKKYIIE